MLQTSKVVRPRREVPERLLRNARLVSGLVMMTFLVMHLGNLALVLVSLDLAEAVRPYVIGVWQTPPGTLLLYGSALVHVVLVLRTLYRRRTLVMPATEAVQTIFGLVIPIWIAEHVLGTRVFAAASGINPTYDYVVHALWISAPSLGVRQVVALIVIWAHGCVGLHFWLRHRPWYGRAAPLLLTAAVLGAVLPLLGFVDAGRTIQAAGTPLFPPGTDVAAVERGVARKDLLLPLVYAGTVGAVALVLLLRRLRRYRQRHSLVEIRYATGQGVRVPRGTSVLEASRIGGIPHYAVCGGRGRCSTCRIRVVEGLADLDAPGPIERSTLSRIHAEPDVRLACQLRPKHALSVIPLLNPAVSLAVISGGPQSAPGRERDIAVLFCDIRGFTALADRRLPYDVVFLLNRYFAIVGRAVEQSGGRLDKFIGDGAMALFGLEASREQACRQALDAAASILVELDRLGAELAGEIGATLRVAIGIHAGPAIVGSMGYGGVMGVTAIGDTVNVASRLESAAKEADAAIVVSEAAAQLSGLDLSGYELRTIDIRGSAEPLAVRVVPQQAGFEPHLLAKPSAA